MPHSLRMPGPAKLIDATSKPSSALSATVMPMTSTWSARICDRAIRPRGSVSCTFMGLLPRAGEFEFVDLACAGFGQRVQHFDPLRHLVVDQTVSAVRE